MIDKLLISAIDSVPSHEERWQPTQHLRWKAGVLQQLWKSNEGGEQWRPIEEFE